MLIKDVKQAVIIMCTNQKVSTNESSLITKWQISIVIPFLIGKILPTQQFRRVALLPQGGLLVINPKGILFIS